MRKRLDDSMIDLRDPASWRARRPILIAHRGGVVGAGSPENSRKAIRQAAADGYDIVELDVTSSKDGVPMLFHGVGGRLRGTSAGDGFPAEFTASELMAIRYDGSDEPITTLADGLELCASLGFGVMLDLKVNYGVDLDTAGARQFVERIGSLLDDARLTSAAMTITRHRLVDELLADRLLRSIGVDELAELSPNGEMTLATRFWFGLPRELPDPMVTSLQEAGALVIPAINTFRYRAGASDPQARADIRRLLVAGVDGFQIDSVFRDAFTPVA